MEFAAADRLGRLPVRAAARWSAVAAATALFVGATAPAGALSVLTARSPPGPVGIDVWLHFVGYAGLGGVLACVVRSGALDRRSGGPRGGFVLAFGPAAGYGILVELLHALLPYRSFSGLDVAANVLGAFLGCALVWAVLSARYRYGREHRQGSRERVFRQ